MRIIHPEYTIEEKDTLAAHTVGKITAPHADGFTKGVQEFYSRYPKGGYSSHVGLVLIKNREWTATTERLSSCE